MAHYYKFYQVKEDHKEDGTVFYVQCEWYNKSFDLNVDGDLTEEYCHLTITDLTDYWQITINRELLLANFKPSSALNPLLRSKVLYLALQGYQRILKQKVSWVIIKENENDRLKLRLKTYYDVNLPGIAGSLLIDKTPEDQNNELQKLWFKNSAIASQTATETEDALSERIQDVEETCKSLQESVDTMKRETVEYKFTVFSNFSKVLNAKKDKIRDLKNTVEDLKKRQREDDDGDDVKEEESTESSQRPKKMQKTGSSSKAASASQPMIKNEDEEMPPPEPVATAASAPVRNDDSSDDDSFGDEDLLLSMPETM